MLNYVWMIAAGLIGLFVWDYVVGLTMRWLAPFLPQDLAGQDGWLVDTKNSTGVFDRRKT